MDGSVGAGRHFGGLERGVRESRLRWLRNGRIVREFRKGRGCVDQIFSFRMVVEKILENRKKLYAAFMDLEKAYDRVDWLVYLSSAEGTNRRERPLERWDARVKRYVSERGVRENGLEWTRRECMDRERRRSICCSYLLGECFWRERGIRAID